MGSNLKNTIVYRAGKYLGYPECCILWFVKYAGILNPQQEKVHGNRGFIPCPSCAKKVTKNTIHTLIKNRKCPIPYPNAPCGQKLIDLIKKDSKKIV